MASIYGGASGNGWKLRLDYTVTQDRAANTSSLRLRLYLYANTTGSYNLEKDSAYYVLQGQRSIRRISTRRRDGICWESGR
mgnify:CR=1 FL=1